MMRRWLRFESKTVTAGAVILVVSGLGSRLLGLVRDRIFAGMFGAGDVLDAYYAAFRIPDVLFSVLVAGALSASLVPVFVSTRHDSIEEGWRLLNNIFGVALVALVGVAVVFTVAASALIDVVAPGFTGILRDQAVMLTRIMMMSPILLGISSIFSGVLQSLHRFVAYAIAPLLYNAGIILGALFFVPVMGVAGLAWGVVLGALLHLAIQLSALRGISFSLRPFVLPLTSGIKDIVRLMVPRTIGVGVYQVNLIAITAIASFLSAGSITIFNFSNNLHYVPVGAVGIPFAVAAFPRLSEAFSHRNRERFRDLLLQTVRTILYWVVPISMLVIVLRAQVVRVVLGSGSFTQGATQLTAASLTFFSVSMVAQALIPLLARAFYAQHNTKIPVAIGVVSMAATIAFAIAFVDLLGSGWGGSVRLFLSLDDVRDIAVLGLPIAFSLGGFLHVSALALMLWRAGVWDVRSSMAVFGQSLAAAFVAAVAAWVFAHSLAGVAPLETFMGSLMQGGLAGVGGLIVYWGITHVIFRMPEASLRRLWRYRIR